MQSISPRWSSVSTSSIPWCPTLCICKIEKSDAASCYNVSVLNCSVHCYRLCDCDNVVICLMRSRSEWECLAVNTVWAIVGSTSEILVFDACGAVELRRRSGKATTAQVQTLPSTQMVATRKDQYVVSRHIAPPVSSHSLSMHILSAEQEPIQNSIDSFRGSLLIASQTELCHCHYNN